MSNFKQRLIPFCLTISVIALLLYFAFSPWVQYTVAGIVALVAALASWEYVQFVKDKGGNFSQPLLLFLVFCQTLAFFAAVKFPGLQLPSIVFVTSLLLLFLFHFHSKEGAIVDLATACFGLVYIALPLGMLLNILYFPGMKEEGRLWLIYLLIVTKTTDLGGYLAGNLFGKRKLAPHISPGKTIEGSVVGILSSAAASVLFAYYFHFFSIPKAIVFGLLLGILASIGDLVESLLKRDANKKDSNALPGLGGALDMIDSLLLTIPVVYIYLRIHS